MEKIEILKIEDKLFSDLKKVFAELKGTLTCKNEKSLQKVIRKVVRRIDRDERIVEKEY